MADEHPALPAAAAAVAAAVVSPIAAQLEPFDPLRRGHRPTPAAASQPPAGDRARPECSRSAARRDEAPGAEPAARSPQQQPAKGARLCDQSATRQPADDGAPHADGGGADGGGGGGGGSCRKSNGPPRLAKQPHHDHNHNHRPSNHDQRPEATDEPAVYSNGQAETPDDTPLPERGDDIQLRVGEKLEACDSTGTWYPAKIVAIDAPQQSLLIHFIRWSTRFDQWMRMDSDHLRPMPTPGEDPDESASQRRFVAEDLVLAAWSDNRKYPGRILKVCSDGNYNILFFDGYRKKVRRQLVEPLPPDYNQEQADAEHAVAVSQMQAAPNHQSASANPGSNCAENHLDAPSTPVQPPPQQQQQPATFALQTPVQPPPPTPPASDGKPAKSRRSSTVQANAAASPLLLPVATKEFVVEADHNQFKCTVNGCNKSFRKETLLGSHIKHYHPEHCASPASRTPSRPEPSRRRSTLAKQPSGDRSEEERPPSADRQEPARDKERPAEQSNGIARSSAKSTKAKPERANRLDSPPGASAASGKENAAADGSAKPDGQPFSAQPDGEPKPDPASTSNGGKRLKKRRPPPASRQRPSKAAVTGASATAEPSTNHQQSILDEAGIEPPASGRKACTQPALADLSDSTIEEAPVKPVGQETASRRKKRSSQRRPAPSPSVRPASELFPDEHFDIDDDCFESADESRVNSPKKKKRYRRNETINKQLLNLKIDLQERRDRQRNDFQDEPFLSNTPSTSSASESALAESADFGDFHGYDDKRFCDYSPLGDALDRKKKKPGKVCLTMPSGKKTKPEYVSAGSPLLSTPLPSALTAPFRRHLSFRNEPGWSSNLENSVSAMSPRSVPAERPVPANELPFWDARIVKDIHESDEVDEMVHCICDYKEESGLMIQCEVCLTWQHGLCFKIEDEDQVPDCYVCFACRDPKNGRESQRYIYDQEWLAKGKLPTLFLETDTMDDQQKRDRLQCELSRTQMCSTNQLLAIIVEITLILKSLRHKLNLLREDRMEELRGWQAHIPKEELPCSEQAQHSTAHHSELNMKAKFKAIEPEELHNGDNEMIGDILSLSKNILETVPCNAVKTERGLDDEDEELKNADDLDDATDLIDFITSAGREPDKPNELSLSGDLKKELICADVDFHPIEQKPSLPLDERMLDPLSTTEEQHLPPSPVKMERTHQADELMLDHIVAVQADILLKLALVEKKVLELELEMGCEKSGDLDLKEDLLFFKDAIKGIYKDLDLVKELAERHSSFSSHV